MMPMSEAYFCDRCEELATAPPAARVTTRDGEFDLCPECTESLGEWWGLDESEPEREQTPSTPTSNISTE